MKTIKLIALSWACIAVLPVMGVAQPAENPTNALALATTNAPAPAALKEALPPDGQPPVLAGTNQPPLAEGAAPAKDPATAPDAKPAEPPKPAEAPMQVSPAPTHVFANGEKGLLLNFRNAPLELVLNYLSEAAGFVIIAETDVHGKIDVWSNQPLTKEEAVDVFTQVLGKNGYAVLRSGRNITVMKKEDAKANGETPVKVGSDPDPIPRNDEIVTQIIPVQFINAVQLSKDLLPLIPLSTTVAANEGGNSLLVTDTQRNIHRLAEIIKALDTSVSSLSKVSVFQLKYADAKTVATMIKEVFANSDASSRNGRGGGGIFAFMGGGRGGGGMPGMGGDSGSGSSTGRPGASKVVATSDDRSNSLVVSAPGDLMGTIKELVESVDTNVEDVTEIRVFKLIYSDPQEMADLLTNLFPDETNSRNSQGSGFGRRGFFGGGMPGFGGGGGNTGSGDQSDRLKKQSQVKAVPDMRTGSVVVTAARDTMESISRMIEQLDANPAKKMKVHVFTMKNGDVQNAEDTIRSLFTSANSRNNASSTQNRSALENREQQMMNQQQSSGMTSGFGGQGGSGGNRSGSFR